MFRDINLLSLICTSSDVVIWYWLIGDHPVELLNNHKTIPQKHGEELLKSIRINAEIEKKSIYFYQNYFYLKKKKRTQNIYFLIENKRIIVH